MIKPIWISNCILYSLTLLPGSTALFADPHADCAWKGPSLEWVENLPLPAGDVSGPLGATIVPYLQNLNVPVSFVSSGNYDPMIRLTLRPPATVRDALEQIDIQATSFRSGPVTGRLVIYPKDAEFDRVVNLGDVRTASRAAAYFLVLEALRAKCPILHSLDIGFSGHWLGSGKMPFADQIEMGGAKSVIEHLVSLLDKRPSAVFVLHPSVHPSRGKLVFTYRWIDLIEGIELHLPSVTSIGYSMTAVVTGILMDGSRVSLIGAGCEVSYGTSDPSVLEIDSDGRVSTKKRGAAKISVEYEHRTAIANVHVN